MYTRVRFNWKPADRQVGISFVTFIKDFPNTLQAKGRATHTCVCTKARKERRE